MNAHQLVNGFINNRSHYQLKAIKKDSTIDYSNWYDNKQSVIDLKEELKGLNEYSSFSINRKLDKLKIQHEKPPILETLTDDYNDEIITEALATSTLEKAILLTLKYLRRKTGFSNMFTNLGLERFKNSKERGYGARFYVPGKKIESFRLNWTSKTGDSSSLHSIDFWLGNQQGPNFHMAFEHDISIVQVLPQLVDILKAGKVKPGTFITYPEDVSLKEEVESDVTFILNEMALDPEAAYEGVVTMISQPNFTKNKVWKTWKSIGVKIFEALEIEYPNLLQKSGRSYEWGGSDKDVKYLLQQKDRILQQIGTVRGAVSRGSAKETYSANKELDALEAQREKISYEKQLEDLENLIKMTISGASNALFIAGRGGIGKTHTTEKVLSDAGLKDGAGYFKNTGTASAAGLYTLLFQYRDEIILFDDSDDALKDTESRNLIKAATDTKPVRKMVWNKMGKNVVDPDSYDGTDDDMIDEGKIPRYFEFTGKVIFISNLSLDKLDPDGAIRTRAFIIDINPTDVEVYDFMEAIVGKIPLDGDLNLDLMQRKKIVSLLRDSTSKQTANLRKLSRALNMKAGSMKSGVSISDGELTRMISTYA
jgi:hypothetical protein